jgi:hypothetical protein
MWRVVSLSLVLVIGVAIIDVASAVAAGTSLQQKILPTNCVFETINDGTNTLRYLTPAECGVVTERPVAGSSDLPSQLAEQQRRSGLYDPHRQVFFMPNSASNTDKSVNTALRLPWRPIVDVASQNADQDVRTVESTLNGKTVVVTLVGVVAIVALLIFVI